MPKPVAATRSRRAEVATVEELYLTGLRIEQLYSPAFEPDPYYEEALRREPNDYRANTALGILYCKRGRFAAAEEKLRAAIGQSRRNYIRPKDTEADYYLGVSLARSGPVFGSRRRLPGRRLEPGLARRQLLRPGRTGLPPPRLG